MTSPDVILFCDCRSGGSPRRNNAPRPILKFVAAEKNGSAYSSRGGGTLGVAGRWAWRLFGRVLRTLGGKNVGKCRLRAHQHPLLQPLSNLLEPAPCNNIQGKTRASARDGTRAGGCAASCIDS